MQSEQNQLLVHSAAPIADIVLEYDGRSSTSNGAPERTAPTKHGSNNFLKYLQQLTSGKPPIQATMMQKLEKEVRSVREYCLLHTLLSPILAVHKCTAVQVSS